MNKAEVTLFDWELFIYRNDYFLSGVADRHPRLGKFAYVSCSSPIVDYVYEGDTLIFETMNTVYICKLAYMALSPYKKTEEKMKEKLTHRADYSDCILDKIIAASAKMSVGISDDEFVKNIVALQQVGQVEIEKIKKDYIDSIIDIARQYHNCIYIEVSDVEHGNILAYHIGECVGVVEPRLHVGTFQDSILYTKMAADDRLCFDFRYFPLGIWGDTIETYVWSENIERAIIKNDSNRILVFNGVKVPIGETVVLEYDGNY